MPHAAASGLAAIATATPETFWGVTSTGWTAANAIAAGLQTLVLIVAAVLAFTQLKLSERSELEEILKMQGLLDSFRDARAKMFKTLPLELVVQESQFADHAPSRHREYHFSDDEKKRMELTDEQQAALASLTSEQLDTARQVISSLSFLAELIEDGYVPKNVFFGANYGMVLRCCHLVEPVRRHFETPGHGGGNYGHRMLRLRQSAARYTRMIPKHRVTEIDVWSESHHVAIYEPILNPGIGELVVWALRRWTSSY